MFVMTPLLFMTETGPRRFVTKLLTDFMRLSGPQKIKFLREQVPTLKDNTILKNVLDLCQRRNRILHTSLEYSEVKALPDQPYVAGLHDHLPESAFVQRPALTTHRQFGNPLKQASEDYQTACNFHDLMLGVVPFDPWPPSGITDEN